MKVSPPPTDINLNVLGWHLLTLSPPTAEVINRCPGRKGVESEGTYRLRESDRACERRRVGLKGQSRR